MLDAVNVKRFENMPVREYNALISANDPQALEYARMTTPKQHLNKVVGQNARLSIANAEVEQIREDNRKRLNEAREKADSLAKVERAKRAMRAITLAYNVIAEMESRLNEMTELTITTAKLEMEMESNKTSE
jgi:hypothetical protein